MVRSFQDLKIKCFSSSFLSFFFRRCNISPTFEVYIKIQMVNTLYFFILLFLPHTHTQILNPPTTHNPTYPTYLKSPPPHTHTHPHTPPFEGELVLNHQNRSWDWFMNLGSLCWVCSSTTDKSVELEVTELSHKIFSCLNSNLSWIAYKMQQFGNRKDLGVG